MPRPPRNLIHQNLRPIIATNTDQSIVPQTVHMLIVMVTDGDQLPAHELRQCPNLHPIPLILSQLPNLQVSRNPILPNPTHHKQLPLLDARATPAHQSGERELNGHRRGQSLPPPLLQFKLHNRKWLAGGEIQRPIEENPIMVRILIQNWTKPIELGPGIRAGVIDEGRTGS